MSKFKPVNAFFEIKRAGTTTQVPFARLEHYSTGYVLRLRGWREGRFCAIGYDGSDEHFIQGNLIFEGPLTPSGERLTQLCGAIWSDCNATGNAAYNGVLFCSPWPLVAMMKYKEESLAAFGIVLRVVVT